MNHDSYTDAYIADILSSCRTMAMVGASPNVSRPSYFAMKYLMGKGFSVIPVNPGHAEILGEKAYKSLLDVPGPVDIVNIFREPSAVPEIVDQAIQKKAKVIWMQEGIVHNEAAEKARAAGLKVVQNKCIYKEHRDL